MGWYWIKGGEGVIVSEGLVEGRGVIGGGGGKGGAVERRRIVVKKRKCAPLQELSCQSHVYLSLTLSCTPFAAPDHKNPDTRTVKVIGNVQSSVTPICEASPKKIAIKMKGAK